MIRVAVVVHSDTGSCRRLADAVIDGVRSVGEAEAERFDVPSVRWDALAAADAIVFGCPTYMGSASGAFKAFMDDSSPAAWVAGAWRDKIAAGFTSSGSPSGDKLATLQQLAVFAAQHGMVWVGLDLFPGDTNRLGSNLGAMAWTPVGQPPAPADLRAAHRLGVRVARATQRWTGRMPATAGIHPTARDWAMPGPRASGPLPRVNLRELMARPERFEHHLVPVARIGSAQLEVVTAGEPLSFGHVNRSDEYFLSLPTGDAFVSAVPLLTLLSDPETGEDVGRIKHREGDLVLHPHGLLHWPGRLRPPYAGFSFPPGTRRCGLSVVLCANEEVGPGARPLGARDGDCKSYGPAVPFGLSNAFEGPPGPVAEVAGVLWSSVRGEVAPDRGGWLLVLAPGASGLFEDDLVRIPPGGRVGGIDRGLLLAHPDREPDPVPPTWDRLPEPSFPAYEDGEPGTLPFEGGGVRVEAVDSGTARFVVGDRAAEVPRFWAARMLFRVGLHGLWLGYLETYGGLWWDDRGGYRLGLRGGPGVPLDGVALDQRTAASTLEALYRAVAPPGYSERPPA